MNPDVRRLTSAADTQGGVLPVAKGVHGAHLALAEEQKLPEAATQGAVAPFVRDLKTLLDKERRVPRTRVGPRDSMST